MLHPVGQLSISSNARFEVIPKRDVFSKVRFPRESEEEFIVAPFGCPTTPLARATSHPRRNAPRQTSAHPVRAPQAARRRARPNPRVPPVITTVLAPVPVPLPTLANLNPVHSHAKARQQNPFANRRLSQLLPPNHKPTHASHAATSLLPRPIALPLFVERRVP